MSFYASWSLRDLAALGVGALGLAGIIAFIGPQVRAAPSLTSGLTSGRGVTDGEFGRRVVAAFPVGSRGESLVAELKRQGFTSTDWLAAGDAERLAVRRETDRACAPAARIQWRTDPDGRVSVVRGTYKDEGCP